jgi:hypothetical protein
LIKFLVPTLHYPTHNLFLDDNLIHITDSHAKISIIDVKHQTEPVEIRYFETLSCAKEIIVRENLAYYPPPLRVLWVDSD